MSKEQEREALARKMVNEFAIAVLYGTDEQRFAAGESLVAALASPAAEPVQALTNEQIDHLWDSHVGEPNPNYPLEVSDVRGFARAVLLASPPATKEAKADAVLRALDDLGDDAAVHIWPDDLEKCSRSECAVEVYSVRYGSPDGETVPLFSREQVAQALRVAPEGAA